MSEDLLESKEAEVESHQRRRQVSFDASVPDNVFNTAKYSHTPKISHRSIAYKDPTKRESSTVLAPPSSISKPNYEDMLRRVSVVIHQHIAKCDDRLTHAMSDELEAGMFHYSKLKAFAEENFVAEKFVYHFVRTPVCRIGGFSYAIRKLKHEYTTPTLTDVHTLLYDVFSKAKLSAECSIVCLIYCERLMEMAHVPISAETWRPCLLCALLLASKVWQDISSWNVEISEIYPQYSLQSINKLERLFCSELNWDLYISSSSYAKYYFALRSLAEKSDFRRNYTVMRNTEAPGADTIAQRSGDVKEMMLSRSI